MTQNKNDPVTPQPQISNNIYYTSLFIILLWIFIGIFAFVQSLICFGYDGSNCDKIIGLIIASLFGPFYWIFYGTNNQYCKFRK